MKIKNKIFIAFTIIVLFFASISVASQEIKDYKRESKGLLKLPKNFTGLTKEQKIVILKELILKVEEKIEKLINNKKNMNLEEGKNYTTESGIKYEVLKLGTGEKPNATDKVEVHYHGTYLDGKVFDSSVDRGEKITFGLNQVIAGWTEGLQLMPVGSKFKFTIPAKLAYGESTDICVPKSFLESAQGQSIPKEAFTGKKCKAQTENGEEDGEFLINPQAHPMTGKTLVFEVELFDIKK